MSSVAPAPQVAPSRSKLLISALVGQRHRDLVSVTKDYLTILALLVGGGWTAWTVYDYRTPFPIVTTSHRIRHWPLPSNRTLLAVDLDVTNAGKVLIRPLLSRISILQVLPLGARELEALGRGDLAPAGRRDVNWPKIAGKDYPQETRQLEPGETEPFHYEFVIPDSVQVVAVYTFVNNPKLSSRRGEVGWQRVTLYDLRTGEGGTLAAPKTTSDKAPGG